MLSITINNQTISMYLKGYDVNIETVHDSSLNYTAMSGATISPVLGIKRTLTVQFEPMSNTQIQQLFTTISTTQANSITYQDPMSGEVTKSFLCESLPAASYFESDDGVLFWTIPDIVFTEDVDFSSAWDSG